MAYTLNSFGNITNSCIGGGIKTNLLDNIYKPINSLGNITRDVNVSISNRIKIDSFGNVFNSCGRQTPYKMPLGYTGPREFHIDSFGKPISSDFGLNLYKLPWQR